MTEEDQPRAEVGGTSSHAEAVPDLEAARAQDIHLTELLSYSDVLKGEARQAAIEYTEQSANAQKYKETLSGVIDEFGEAPVVGLATRLRDQCLSDMGRLGIPKTQYADSVSWALWDLAKQRYYADHPKEAEPEYQDFAHHVTVGNPFAKDKDAMRKRKEVVDRHMGWEFEQAVNSGQMAVEDVHWIARDEVSDAYKRGERHDDGSLRSFELAKLGRRLRRQLAS